MKPDWTIIFWHWWIFALVMLILEAFAPAAFFLWLGVAAIVVGFVLWIVPAIGIEFQFILFAVLSVASIVGWRNYRRRHPAVSDQPTLNKRGRQYVGRVFTLGEPIVNGTGKIRVDDSTWKITGTDLPAGSRVKVIASDGVVLRVAACAAAAGESGKDAA